MGIIIHGYQVCYCKRIKNIQKNNPKTKNPKKESKRRIQKTKSKNEIENNKHRTCEAWLSKTALESHEDANTCQYTHQVTF